MDQTRALNALAPFLALAKSATSPRAAADLIAQATSAPNTYVFAELLQQNNIRALAHDGQHGASYELLKLFAWGTWEDYHSAASNATLPPLSDAQANKLRLLSLLSIAASSSSSSFSAPVNGNSGAGGSADRLTYASLIKRLDLPSPAAVESLLTQAIYAGLLTATLNPAAQTVVISSVAPLRDLAPGSVGAMLAELEAWSARCGGVLAGLEAEVERVRDEAARRAKREGRAERQVSAVMAEEEKGGVGARGLGFTYSGKGHNTRGGKKVKSLIDDDGEEGEEEGDAMDVDGGVGLVGGGKKRPMRDFLRGGGGSGKSGR